MELTEELQFEHLLNVERNCILDYGVSVVNNSEPFKNSTTLMCPAFFDKVICWPYTKADTVATVPCPAYIKGFNSSMNATRVCTDTGRWFFHPEYNESWTNYTLCKPSVEESSELWPEYIPIIKTVSRVGYTISFCTLLVAFIIMVSIKKLHCPRNKLHMHLFASFILRAGLILLKDLLFEQGIGLSSDVSSNKFFEPQSSSNNWSCKLMISLWEYCIIANYSWILMEGLYLHNLIYRALFADCSRNITHYVALGWGMPLIVIISWIITRLNLENTLCWTTHESHIFLIILIPITISVLINFILFMRIAFIIYSKLQAPIYEEARRYQKWARSTLVLIPLFGIHYVFFIGLWYFKEKPEIVEMICLSIDQLFASLQGFFVAVLYCFMNGEVRSELKPHVHSLLTFCATSECMKHCFPCRDKYLRSASRGRTSVCTTLSFSSVCNNGVNLHRNSKTKWDVMTKSRNSIQEKNKEHVCRPNMRSWQDMSTRWNGRSPSECSRSTQQYTFCSNRSIPETMLSFDHDEKSRSEPLIAENICMLPQPNP